MRGVLIVFDGPDGSGTSTHAAILSERLQRRGCAAIVTSEPTDGPIGTQIRQCLMKGSVDPMALQLLFTEDRAWHVKTVIEPALRAGTIVVCDRYWPSTIVYAEAQGLDSQELKKLNTKFLQPDCMIFTLPPLHVCLERLGRRMERDIFERADLQKKIHAGYRAMAAANSQIRTVDTSGEKDENAEEIWTCVKPFLA